MTARGSTESDETRGRGMAELEAALQAVTTALRASESQVAALIAERAKLKEAYDRLLERMALLTRRLFVAKAERIDATQLELEFAETKAKLDAAAAALDDASRDDVNDAPSGEPEPDPAPATGGPADTPKDKRRKPKGRRNLAEQDLEVQRIELLDPTRAATDEIIRFEESSKLGYRRGGHVRLVLARAVYKSACAAMPTTFPTAPMPPELFPRGLLAPSMIAHILVDKYGRGLPFYRQAEAFAESGVDLDRGTMCRYAEGVGNAVGATVIAAMAKDAIATAFCLSTDATGVAVQPEPLADGKRQACRRGHFFVVLADQDHIFFEYQAKQTSAAVSTMFRGFSGYIQADAHAVYDVLYRHEEGSTTKPPQEVGCWAHARRRFWEAATCHHEEGREGVLRIRAIFLADEALAKLPPEQRHARRQTHVRPLVDSFFDWARPRFDAVGDARGLVRDALGYAVRQEAPLRRFLEDGRLVLTNNGAERALRTIAVGRKNWLFVGSDDHGEAAAGIFSLLASCRLHGIEPETYLAELIHLLPQWPKDRMLELSPKHWRATRARLDDAELDREIGWITVPPPPAEEPTTKL